MSKESIKHNEYLLDYKTLINERLLFKKSGTTNGGDFNYFDVPSNKFFKLIFYFINGDSDNEKSISASGGLLAPTWNVNNCEQQLYNYNSAWAYLKLNGEDERADKLKNFISLLSNINSESPWYFSEISGLDTALERKQTMENDFKFEDQRPKISIKCLPDSFDDRIGTLLDLYRSIVWSWSMKREVVPSNLRKFDMGLYIYNAPTIPYHHYKFDPESKGDLNYKYADLGKTSGYQTSYKYIEFHNCEIDYNSSKTAYNTLSNKEDFNPEYTIDIYFDDCYENRFNEFLLKDIGDMIAYDTQSSFIDYNKQKEFLNDKPDVPTITEHQQQHEEILQSTTLDHMINYYQGSIGTELIGALKDKGKEILKKIYLGNIYGLSISKIGTQLSQAADGHVFSTAAAIKDYNRNIKDKKRKKKYIKHNLGNIYHADTLKNNI